MTNSSEEFRGIIADFKKLPSKVQQENSTVKKTLKDRETVLTACQKEYEKLYYAHEALKKIWPA